MVLLRDASLILPTLQQSKEKLKSDNTQTTFITAINGYYNTLPMTYITITSKLPTNYSANITKLIP